MELIVQSAARKKGAAAQSHQAGRVPPKPFHSPNPKNARRQRSIRDHIQKQLRSFVSGVNNGGIGHRILSEHSDDDSSREEQQVSKSQPVMRLPHSSVEWSLFLCCPNKTDRSEKECKANGRNNHKLQCPFRELQRRMYAAHILVYGVERLIVQTRP